MLGRGTLDATLDEGRTEATFHEAGLVLGRVPDFGHDQMAVLVEARRVDLQSVGPVPRAGGRDRCRARRSPRRTPWW